MTEKPFEILRISDGTVSATGVPNMVDLLSDGSGFCLQSWNPAITEPKGGGVWADSQLADGRQQRVRHVQNVTEAMVIDVHGWDADGLARKTQMLRRLLTQASQFWTTSWARIPVWIEARAVRETNSRYAVIRGWSTPQDSDHYGALFWQKVARADMADFDLILEREPYWRDTEPGDSTCLPITGSQLTTLAHSLLFYSDDSVVDIPDVALFEDLPLADFTVEAWIKADGWGHFDLGQIVAEGSWTINLNIGTGIYANTDYTTSDAVSQTTTSDFSPDSLWHHIAAVWDQSAHEWTLWIDGVDDTNTQTAGVGAYTNASAEHVAIGNYPGVTVRDFDGEIGWVRISDNTRYTGGFTPPTQCQLPLDDANTLWVGLYWPIYNVTGVYTSAVTDESSNGNDGTASAATWTISCQEEYGSPETCSAGSVFLGNSHKYAGLSYVWYYDDNLATYSTNLLTQSLSYSILPAVPALSDCLYLGSDDTAAQGFGPFNSAAFNLGPTQTGIVSMDWEYYDGAVWTAFATLADNTSISATFDNGGISSVHWQQPDDWDTTTVNGIVGYWARAIVTSISGAPTSPVQLDEHVYTISWPFINVAEDQIGGDVRGLARNQLNAVARYFGADQIIAGLRTLSRGEDFTAFLNISDVQWPDWYSVIKAAAVTWIDDTTAPTGRSAYWNPGGDATTTVFAIIGSDTTQDFYGKYHAYLRVSQLGGAAKDMSAYLTVSNGLSTGTNYDPAFTAGVAGTLELLDLGAVILPATEVLYTEDAFAIYLTINLENVGGAAPALTVYDVILMPTDEWSVDTSGDIGTGYFDQTAYADLDSAVQLKREFASTLWFYSSVIGGDSQVERWQASAAGPFILQANQDQRLWVLCLEDGVPEIEISHSSQIWRVQQYFSLRGDR